MMKNSKIIGVGHYVPENIVTNDDLSKFMDTYDEWITERTGIKERRWVSEGQTISELAYNATVKALKMAKMEASELDFIVFASLGSDFEFPGGGCFLNEKLGIPGVPAIDIRNQCSGFVYGLTMADQFIKTGMYKNILIVASEIQSNSLNLTNEGRDTTIIFGDGAGAVVLTATEESGKGILGSKLHTDGRYTKELCLELPNINQKPRISEEMLKSDKIYPYMNGRFVFKHAVVKFPGVIKEVLDKTGIKPEDVDVVIPHQANLRITEAVSKRLGIGMDKFVSNIHKYGNTTAASIPIALSEAFEEGRIKENDIICLAAFGSGFTWGAMMIRW